MIQIRDSSAWKIENLVLLGNDLVPDKAIYYDDTDSTTISSGSNETLLIQGVFVGRRWSQNAQLYTGINNGFIYGLYIGGPNLVNNDEFSVKECRFFDCSSAGVLIASNQSIWGSFENVSLDTCGYGIDTRSNLQPRNVCFNRNTIADLRIRDNTIHDVVGFNAENSKLLIHQSLNASVRVNGGKALLNGTLMTGPYWAQFTQAKDVHFENWLVDVGTAVGRRLQVSASSTQRSRVYIRHCRLPNGDTRDGYELNAGASSGGLQYDIEEGAFKAKGTLDGSIWVDPTTLVDTATLLQSLSIGATPTGTVSTTSGSATITGTNTIFTDLRPGQQIIISDTSEVLTILSIASATSMSATANAANTEASSAYRIIIVADGDPVIPALGADLSGMLLTGNCYDNNFLYARINNESGGTVDPGSMAGTVTISAGGTTLTGSGSDFTPARSRAGDYRNQLIRDANRRDNRLGDLAHRTDCRRVHCYGKRIPSEAQTALAQDRRQRNQGQRHGHIRRRGACLARGRNLHGHRALRLGRLCLLDLHDRRSRDDEIGLCIGSKYGFRSSPERKRHRVQYRLWHAHRLRYQGVSIRFHGRQNARHPVLGGRGGQ